MVTAVIGQDANDWSQPANDSRHTGHDPNVDDIRNTPEVEWEASDGFVVDQPPVVSDGTVYYWYRGDISLVARNSTIGELIWRDSNITPVKNIPPVPGSPPAVAENLYIPLADRLQAYNKTTGTKLWTKNITGESITVYSNIIYIPTGERLHAVDGSTGDTIWNTTAPYVGGNDISVADGTVYLAENTTITSLNASTGREEARYTVVKDGGEVSSDIVADGILSGIVVDNGLIYTETGEEEV